VTFGRGSVCLGEDNTASGDFSAVTGGRLNSAIAKWSAVSGGCAQTAGTICEHLP